MFYPNLTGVYSNSFGLSNFMTNIIFITQTDVFAGAISNILLSFNSTGTIFWQTKLL